MRVLMLVQQLDERNWLRGFTVGWVRELARHVERLDVATLELGPVELPNNVYPRSMGKERHDNKLYKFWGFQRAVAPVVAQADVIFTHMTPIYTVLAAPYATLFRKKQALWFVHRQPTTILRTALAASWRITTAVPDSFPFQTDKLRALGHGIDMDFFAPGDAPSTDSEGRGYIVHVARLMPIKHQTTLLRAIAKIPHAHAVLIGAIPVNVSRDYERDLHALVVELGLEDRVTFTGGIPPNEARDWYRRAAVAVNLSPVGLFDKAALEGMAVGVPTVVSNPAFDALLGSDVDALRIGAPDDVAGLEGRLHDLLALRAAERAQVGARLRERVVAAHSLKGLMPRLVRVLETGEL